MPPVASRMNLMEVMRHRASVRNYRPEPLGRSSIDALLEAAIRAPTAIHEEPWAFVVIQDRTVLDRLSERAKPLFVDAMRRAHRDRGGLGVGAFSQPDFDIFHGAPALIIICGRRGAPFAVADCWLAAENLMLAAYAMGLGSCVIGSALGAFEAQDICDEIGIPDDFAAIAPIVVGRPATTITPTDRRPPRVLAWR
jgi:nitroreductase